MSESTQAEHNHLERISLLSTSLAPGVEHLTAVVKVTQVGLGGAHRPEILKHVTQLSTDRQSQYCHPL
jgi:hypothetical protein